MHWDQYGPEYGSGIVGSWLSNPKEELVSDYTAYRNELLFDPY